ncbi:hypothetical protein FBU30_003208 [Linnemannia zychae]|nr:hypothetical protein FBU30_003208 [Linnemannia zychae]
MSSFHFGYGSTNHNGNNAGSASEIPIISADGIVPNPTASEKTPLQYQKYSDHNGSDDYGKKETEHHHDHDEGEVHDHAPGERCSLPQVIQPLVSHENHGMVESVVVKVRDSADVTQKTIFYFWDEWKQFVNRGNVIDLGIGVVIGGAFSDIIDSFVIDILTPPLSLWATGTNLEHSFIVLRHGRTPGKIYTTYLEAQEDGAVTENTGHFLKACLNFLVIAFCLFWIVKAVHNIRREKIRPPPKEKECLWCRENIALEAFRCKFCQSYVRDIPGIEDAGVGMFVTIKRPSSKHPAQQAQQSKLHHDALAAGMAAGFIEKDDDSNHNNPPSRLPSQAQSLSTTGNGTGKQASMVSNDRLSSSSSSAPSYSGNSGSTIGPADGKKIAAALAKVDGA